MTIQNGQWEGIQMFSLMLMDKAHLCIMVVERMAGIVIATITQCMFNSH